MRIREVARWTGRRRVVLFGTAALSVLVLAGGVTAAAVTSLSSGATGGATAVSGGTAVSTAGFPSGAGIFTDSCAYSHEAADDPILAPNDPGAAMHHNFYGNTTTSASSTATSLVGGASTCSTSADSSAYWTPVVYQNGTALTPSSALIYWRKPAKDAKAVQAVPVGLQMIAGNESATAPQSTSVIAWTCDDHSGTSKATATPRNCAAGTDLRLIVAFPSCWTGILSPAPGRPTSSTAPPPDAPAHTPSRSRRSCSTSTTPPQAQPR